MKPFKDTISSCEMTNILPEETGLNYNVLVSTPVAKEDNDPLVLVWLSKEDEFYVPVSISDDPVIMSEHTIPDFNKLKKWILLNKKILLDYWHDDGNHIGSIDVVETIKRVESLGCEDEGGTK
jgi:hypothetical protein